MKYVVVVLFSFFFNLQAWSQVPQKMSYQAVVRDSNGELISNQVISVQISILKASFEGEAVYIETQNPETNGNGLMSLEIGGADANIILGNIPDINWSNDTYFIKTETDLNGGSDYTISGTSQLLSVPYALHAETAERLTGEIAYNETDPIYESSVAAAIQEQDTVKWNNKLDSFTEADPVFSSSIASGITETDTVNWNSKLDQEIDGSIENEIQSLSISETGDTLFLSKSNWVIVPNISSANSETSISPTILENALTSEITPDGTNVTITTTIDNPDIVNISNIGLSILGPSQDVFYSNSEDNPTIVEDSGNPGWYIYTHTFFIPNTAPTGDYTLIDIMVTHEAGEPVFGGTPRFIFIDNG